MLMWNSQVRIPWKYEAGDWVVEPGLPDHHLRIVQQVLDANARWYLIFDTNLFTEGYGNHKWRGADELEWKSRLGARPHPNDVPAVLERTASCRFIKYSILARTDCESLQRWIHSGEERDRWSPQVWIGAGLFGAVILAYAQPKQGRSRYR
jgi:hypothetical protein